MRNFRPPDAELFFDLRRDPGESRRSGAEESSRARALRGVVEASLSPRFHHRVRVEGAGGYDLRLRTTGWIEVVARSGILSGEGPQRVDDSRALVLRLRPEGDRLRPVEVEFVARPNGAPVWIDGTRAGRRLWPSEIRVAATGRTRPSRPVPRPRGGGARLGRGFPAARDVRRLGMARAAPLRPAPRAARPGGPREPEGARLPPVASLGGRPLWLVDRASLHSVGRPADPPGTPWR